VGEIYKTITDGENYHQPSLIISEKGWREIGGKYSRFSCLASHTIRLICIRSIKMNIFRGNPVFTVRKYRVIQGLSLSMHKLLDISSLFIKRKDLNKK